MHTFDKLCIAEGIVSDLIVNIESGSDVNDCYESTLRAKLHSLNLEIRSQILLHPEWPKTNREPYLDFEYTKWKVCNEDYADCKDCKGDKVLRDLEKAEKLLEEYEKKNKSTIISRLRHIWMSTFSYKYNRIRNQKLPGTEGGEWINPITGREVIIKPVTGEEDSKV